MKRSIWQAAARQVDLPALRNDANVDVAIVGGGITGLTAALRLSRSGRRVAVLEAGKIGDGTTGQSTGNLYATIGSRLSTLCEKWGEETTREVVRARASAIDFVEKSVAEFGIDCDFARRDWYLYTPPETLPDESSLERERAAAVAAGLSARLEPNAPLPFATGPTLVIGGQAQFDPLKYVRGLAAAIASERCAIYQDTPVTRIDGNAGVVHTDRGQVSAAHVVMATHTPKGSDLANLQVAPYREYGLALRLGSADYPLGIFWSAADTRRSIRSYRFDGKDYLIVVGEKHKTGQADDTDACQARLEEWARAFFDVASVDMRWSAQGYYSPDELPYIGKSVGSDKVYIATGFAADGLTWGTLAGLVIGDEIAGVDNPFGERFRPARVDPAKAGKKLVVESANVAKEYALGHLGAASAFEKAEALAAGDGRVVKLDGERVAVCRDGENKLHAVSAVCTHMGCIVAWNGAEQSWDCPCHGSRFAANGAVIEGPALEALKPVQLPR
ncbi:MAG TPA: FAD-dependent oxidoreductase [Burkholderiaceae bacterium]|nr:FAD-dependent oxidoreductase [Burkholderiaceae bacterium]